MTSKKLLTELFNEANRLSSEKPKYTTYNLYEMCEQIQKDLEVSEILKKYLFIVEPDNEEDFKEFNRVDYLRLMDFMTREEYEVIKEWLENE